MIPGMRTIARRRVFLFLTVGGMVTLGIMNVMRVKVGVSLREKREGSPPEDTTVLDLLPPNTQRAKLNFSDGEKHLEGLGEALKLNSKNNLIVVATTDLGYVEMTYNLILTSFHRLGIYNYLIACTHQGALTYLKSRGIMRAHLIQNDSHGVESSYYGTANYSPKTHVKAEVTLVALQLGLEVLMVDLDVYIFTNPMTEYLMNPELKEFDLLIRKVHNWYNTGFYLARPRKGLIDVYKRTMSHIHKHPRTREHDQQIFNAYLKDKWKEDGNDSVKVHSLDKAKFPIGPDYFSSRRFAGENPCSECVMVHNCIIMGYELKRYRFKEHLLWDVDTDGYYSDVNRKYLTYTSLPGETYLDQRSRLITALKLSKVLNRVLILPQFYCRGLKTKCPFHDRFKGSIFAFDEHFYGLYREHVFLQHHLVPNSVKQSQSSLINITKLLNQSTGDTRINPGPSTDNIKSNFTNITNTTDLSNVSSSNISNVGVPYKSGHFYYASRKLTRAEHYRNTPELIERFRTFDSFSVLHLDSIEYLHLTLGGFYEQLLESTITEFKYKPKKN